MCRKYYVKGVVPHYVMMMGKILGTSSLTAAPIGLSVAAISFLFFFTDEKTVAAIIHVKETAWFPSRPLLNLCRDKNIRRRFKQCQVIASKLQYDFLINPH